MINEIRKILYDDFIKIIVIIVRVFVFNGYSELINVEFEKQFDLEELKEILKSVSGVVVQDDFVNFLYLMLIYVFGKDEVYVGRIRRDEFVESGVNLWVVVDNIRKGAVINVVQIVEKVIEYFFS